MPVGLIESAEFEVTETTLAAGDKIVIYTDGVTEAQNLARRVFRPAAAAPGGRGASRATPARRCTRRSQSAVAAFTESAPQADDITLVVIEYRGEE